MPGIFCYHALDNVGGNVGGGWFQGGGGGVVLNIRAMWSVVYIFVPCSFLVSFCWAFCVRRDVGAREHLIPFPQ